MVQHGGIARAARLMPTRVQPNGISAQMQRLEEDVGGRLFERQPFALTDLGRELFAHTQPFFSRLEQFSEQLHRRRPVLRIAASEVILQEYLPVVEERMRRQHPRLDLRLRAGSQDDVEAWVRAGLVDLALCAVDSPPPGLERSVLARLPLTLLAPKSRRFESADVLLQQRHVTEPLITVASTESVTRSFRRSLQQRGIDWPAHVETASMALVLWHVMQRRGIGVSLDVPCLARQPKIDSLPLVGFAPVEIAALWREPAGPLVRSLVAIIDARARELWPG